MSILHVPLHSYEYIYYYFIAVYFKGQQNDDDHDDNWENPCVYVINEKIILCNSFYTNNSKTLHEGF